MTTALALWRVSERPGSSALDMWRAAEAWDSHRHPRIPKGQPGAGRFLSTSTPAPTDEQVAEHIERILGPGLQGPLRSMVVEELTIQARFAPRLVLTLRGVDMPPRLPARWAKHLQSTVAYYVPDDQVVEFTAQRWRSSVERRPDPPGFNSASDRRFDAQQVMAHEFGHHVASEVLRQAAPDDRLMLTDVFDDSLGADGAIAGLVRSEGLTLEAALDQWLGGTGARKASERVSTYGATNHDELMAEVWSEYTTAHFPRPEVSAMGAVMERLAGRSGGLGS